MGLKPVFEGMVLQALVQPMSVDDVARAVPCSYSAAYRAVKKLKASGQVHVAMYATSPVNGSLKAVFLAGSGVDAVRPKVMQPWERTKRWRDNRSADDKDFYKARRRQLRRTIKVDPLISAFFGGVR
jgi:hypothetical protein